jgi:hypothetical protein
MTVRDPEVLFELRGEPELLAIADALGDVLGAPISRNRRRWWLAGAGLAAAIGAAAIVAGLLLTTTGVQPSLVDRALAAVGDEPVLHAVIRQKGLSGTALIKLSTGRKTAPPRVAETEIWFDEERALEHTITRVTGEHTQDVLSTPQGVTSDTGPVWTCARIAAHPVEATRAGVSCNFSGENGTTPRHVPEPPPTVDPALLGFVDGYRRALASGTARRIGEGTVHGEHVYWLELRLPDPDTNPGDPRVDFRERVAVAADTYRPLVIRPVTDGVPGLDYEVLEIGTVARADANFSEPKLIPPEERPSSAGAHTIGELDFAGASELLGTRALWAGSELHGLKLAAIQRQEVTIGYGRDSGVPPLVTPVVTLIYGGVERRHPTSGSIEITESTVPVAVRWLEWLETKPVPPGFLRVNRMGWGETRIGDVYVQIKRSPFSPVDDDTLVAAARQLVPVPGG